MEVWGALVMIGIQTSFVAFKRSICFIERRICVGELSLGMFDAFVDGDGVGAFGEHAG